MITHLSYHPTECHGHPVESLQGHLANLIDTFFGCIYRISSRIFNSKNKDRTVSDVIFRRFESFKRDT